MGKLTDCWARIGWRYLRKMVLTNTEFRILSNKAMDPNLSAEERGRSAMLLLFGTQPYKVPDPSPF
ncbi:hypothetical protein K435DRAFT_503778 [Dendrothele bispora CBS 962.96]|uniref:Uncharacterized protein n=1 Tax=Dendrothele bispora (strain CBS 962.96) TaxID=1314807 RepID=A0A4S8KXE9_DENBC|nr:hypothetical protein K435DRAFT_503778 [Dendrothele bispora CBS 962.96]